MKITDIIEQTDRMTANWLEAGMLEDAENCGCKRCKEVVEIIRERKNEENQKT